MELLKAIECIALFTHPACGYTECATPPSPHTNLASHHQALFSFLAPGLNAAAVKGFLLWNMSASQQLLDRHNLGPRYFSVWCPLSSSISRSCGS